MTRTARRRWSRELTTELDGIAVGESGPILLHGYEEPAGGKWIDNVIPGKLSALDRQSGEVKWSSPCEVGYGRGFGAGLGPENDVVVLGPSLQGHRIVRMSLDSGELIDLKAIDPFDLADVSPDVCICVTPDRVFAVLTHEMAEAWEFVCKGVRFHEVGRCGSLAFVVYSNLKQGTQGVMTLDVKTGKRGKDMLAPAGTVIHALAAQEGTATFVVENLETLLSREVLLEHLMKRVEEDPDAEVEEPTGLALLSLDPGDGRTLWFAGIDGSNRGDLPNVTIRGNSGKVYVAQGAMLGVRDALTGRALGELFVPGLDEHIAWQVADGAGLLAEETRASVFEIPD